MSISPVRSREVLGFVDGGSAALAALNERISAGRGSIAADLYQLAERPTADAFHARALRGDAIHVLGDHRLVDGGLGADIAGFTASGSWRTWGDDPTWWQHAKTYHLNGPAGPESWITNLSPIPDTHARTELSVIVGGDAAAAARAVTEATIDGPKHAVQGAIDAAAGHGILVNDPLAGRARLTEGMGDLIDGARREDDLIVITKGIQDDASTSRLMLQHARGRDVGIYVRDLADRDGHRLDAASVPAWIVGGGLKPRVNAVVSGDRAIVGSAFLWKNMVGTPDVTTSRDVGVLLEGRAAAAVRDAALGTVGTMPSHVSVKDALRRGLLPTSI